MASDHVGHGGGKCESGSCLHLGRLSSKRIVERMNSHKVSKGMNDAGV
jgi:hypothetical protein